jgi:phosphoribosyl 1,2-cyclic phosphodiesterase
MRFCMLRSGSSGNCTFVEHGATRILLDAGGMSARGIVSVLAEINRSFSDINALVVTHLHSDHLNHNSLRLCRDHGVPLYIHESNMPALRAIMKKHGITGVPVHPHSGSGFSVGEIEFSPFGVEHDAEELTCGFSFWGRSAPRARVAFATDLGCFPESMVKQFADCECVVLESNHDAGLLWNNPRRPFFHKQRVASDAGHLSNEQAAQALVRICAASRRPPRTIILSHLSEDHNSPEMAIDYVGTALRAAGFSPELYAASRKKKMEFIDCG